MENIGTIIIGILLGVGLAMLYIAYRVTRVMRRLDEALAEVVSQFMLLVIEKENDIYYCYNKQDRKFICQGTDVKTLIEAFKLSYPDKTAVIAEETDPTIIAEFKEAFKS